MSNDEFSEGDSDPEEEESWSRPSTTLSSWNKTPEREREPEPESEPERPQEPLTEEEPLEGTSTFHTHQTLKPAPTLRVATVTTEDQQGSWDSWLPLGLVGRDKKWADFFFFMQFFSISVNVILSCYAIVWNRL